MPSPEYRISGKEVEVRGSGSPAPSAVWLLQSPVNPKPCGTFSWPTSKSPFSPFFLAKSLLLPKPRGKKKHSKTSWSSLLSFRTLWSFSPFQNRMVLSLLLRTSWFLLFFYFRTTWTFIYLLASEPRGSPIYFRAAWSTPSFRAAWSPPLYGCRA